jgi:hypothetical protein
MGAILHSLSGPTVLGTMTIGIGRTPDNQLILHDANVQVTA